MLRSRILSLAFISLVTLGLASACSSGDDNGIKGSSGTVNTDDNPPVPDASPLSDANGVGQIHFDGGLSQKERGAFVAAMDFLDASNVTSPDPRLLQYMKIRSFDRFSVREWLEDRIQYIIPENIDKTRLVELQPNYNKFAYPGQIPPAIKDIMNQGGGGTGSFGSFENVSADQGHVVMSNIGAMFYLLGKADNTLIGYKADGMGTIALTSPRAGILRVGEGLFNALPEDFPARFPNVVRIFHLTTLIHESRHSDGHGVNAGFLHEKCVSGKYKDMDACDHNLNGPYEIEALATKALTDSCANCSTKEKQILNILYLDVNGRRIDDAQTTSWDDAPEGHR